MGLKEKMETTSIFRKGLKVRKNMGSSILFRLVVWE